MSEYVGNITGAGIRRRRLGGIIGLGLTVVVLAVLIFMHASRIARLVLIIPLWIAAAGFFQAREKTCIALGAAGKREVDGAGTCALPDNERAAVSKRVTKVVAESLLAAAIVTAIVCFI